MDSEVEDSQLISMTKACVFDYTQNHNVKPDLPPESENLTKTITSTRKRKEPTPVTLDEPDTVVDQFSKVGNFLKHQMCQIGKLVSTSVSKEVHEKTLSELAEVKKTNDQLQKLVEDQETKISLMQKQLNTQKEQVDTNLEDMMVLAEKMDTFNIQLENLKKWQEIKDAFEGSVDLLEQIFVNKTIKGSYSGFRLYCLQ